MKISKIPKQWWLLVMRTSRNQLPETKTIKGTCNNCVLLITTWITKVHAHGTGSNRTCICCTMPIAWRSKQRTCDETRDGRMHQVAGWTLTWVSQDLSPCPNFPFAEADTWIWVRILHPFPCLASFIWEHLNPSRIPTPMSPMLKHCFLVIAVSHTLFTMCAIS